jgi:hypothetical protein
MTLVMQVRSMPCSRSTRSDVKRVSVSELSEYFVGGFLCFSQHHKSHNNNPRKGSLMMRRRSFSHRSRDGTTERRDKNLHDLGPFHLVLHTLLASSLALIIHAMPDTVTTHDISLLCGFSEASYCSPSRKKKLVSPLRDDSSSSPVLLSTVFFSLDIRGAGSR